MAVFLVAEYLLDFLVERSIEVRNHIVPLQVAVCNLVEIFLDIGSKVISHDAVEILYQVVSDDHSDFLWKEPEFVDRLREMVLDFDKNILGMHDLMVHDYGPGHRIVSFHAEVPEDGDMVELHDIIDNLERRIRRELGCIVTIHMDPVAIEDEEVARLKDEVLSVIKGLDSHIDMHDFRIIRGDTHTNLVFDIAVPFGYITSDDDICNAIQENVRKKLGKNYYTVIEVDRDNYINI